MTDVIDVQGWKGKSGTEVDDTENPGEYTLRMWHQSKETGEVYPETHQVSKQLVEEILDIMREHCTPRMEYGPHWMWRKVIEKYHLDKEMGIDQETMIKIFNGGVARKYYFQYYYFPFKVLEALGYIYYGEKVWMWLG